MRDENSKPSKRPKAGEAFMRALETDPGTQAAWKRAQIRLRIFAAVIRSMQPITAGHTAALLAASMTEKLEAYARESSEELRRVWSETEHSFAKNASEWEEEFGTEYPTSLDEWVRLAVRAGVDADRLIRGRYTLADLAPLIEGYLSRVKDAQLLSTLENADNQNRKPSEKVKAGKQGRRLPLECCALIYCMDTDEFRLMRYVERDYRLRAEYLDVVASKNAEAMWKILSGLDPMDGETHEVRGIDASVIHTAPFMTDKANASNLRKRIRDAAAGHGYSLTEDPLISLGKNSYQLQIPLVILNDSLPIKYHLSFDDIAGSDKRGCEYSYTDILVDENSPNPADLDYDD